MSDETTVSVGDMTLTRDVAPAQWIHDAPRADVAAYTVAALVTNTFPAYARVFHPAQLLAPDYADDYLRPSRQLRWSEAARSCSRVAHPAMEWGAITGSWDDVEAPDGSGLIRPPKAGQLPLEQVADLSQVLAGFTTSALLCWFGLWEGYGHLNFPKVPLFQMPHRSMFLFSGPLSAAPTPFGDEVFTQHASLWWPDDHAWCVATDVDLTSTYIGGSIECIDAIVANTKLESMKVSADQSVTWDTDTLNPTPGPPY